MADSLDLSQLQGLLAQFQPTQADQDAAKQQAMMQFFTGLLGTRKGYEMDRLGESLQNASAARGAYLDNISHQRGQNLQQASQVMGLQEAMRKLNDDAQARQVAVDFYKNRGVTGTPSAQPGPAPVAPGEAPAAIAGQSSPAASPNAAPAALPTAQPDSTSKWAKFNAYSQLAEQYAAKGLVDKAQQMTDLAEKFRPQLESQKTLTTPDGRRVQVNVYKDGSTQVLPDLGPDKEKLAFHNIGNKTIGSDPFNGEMRVSYENAQSPDSVASNATSIRNANMADARAREMHADAQTQANKPQIITGADGQVYAVDSRSGTGREVTGADGQPLNKGSKMTETQSNATAFGMRMKASNDIVNNLEDSGYNVASPKNMLAQNKVTNYAASPEAQALHQAKLNFMTASLRKESGAAISQSEFASEDMKYFPQPGDGPRVIAQKRQSRELALRAMEQQAGSGAKNFASGPSVDDLVKKYAR